VRTLTPTHRARTGTIRAQLIHTPARIAHSAHRQILHLPRAWPYEPGLDELFHAPCMTPYAQPPDHPPCHRPDRRPPVEVEAPDRPAAHSCPSPAIGREIN
jgi:hypothetical protein